MAHSDTVLKQLIALVSRYEFDALAKIHHAGQKFRSYSRWSQFLAMLIGQMSGRRSLRDITDNLKAQGQCLYHLGMKKTSKATLARVNAEQPATLYQILFARLLRRCQLAAPKHKFSFQGKLYLLDATVINLCLSVFPWAEFRQKKGAIKLHMGLDADGSSEFVLTEIQVQAASHGMTNRILGDMQMEKNFQACNFFCFVSCPLMS